MQYQFSNSLNIHDKLFNNVEQKVKDGFHDIHQALQKLEEQILSKAKEIYDKQHQLLIENDPTLESSLIALDRNIVCINKNLDSFAIHAENLAHIKLSLSRVASLVNPERDLYNLIVKREPPPPPTNSELEIFRNMSLEQSLERSLDYDVPRYTTADIISAVKYSESKDPSYQFDIPSFELPPENYYPRTPFQSFRGSDRPPFGGPSRPPPFSRPAPFSGSYLKYSDERASRLETYTSRIPNSTCFVFYLPPSATNETLKSLFERYGVVLNAFVAMDKVTNRTRGFGFVDFASPSEAQAAVEGLDKHPLEGKFLSVSIKV